MEPNRIIKSKATPLDMANIDTDQIIPKQFLKLIQKIGNGSSREHAVWALEDYGFKAIIAPSFADIFYSNCFKNGILPIKLNASDVEYLIRDADDEEIKIDLAVQEVLVAHKILHFQIDESRKKKLLEGLDDIDITLNMESQIAEYEKKKSTSDHMIFTWKIR